VGVGGDGGGRFGRELPAASGDEQLDAQPTFELGDTL
jgi:hypothetical protein